MDDQAIAEALEAVRLKGFEEGFADGYARGRRDGAEIMAAAAGTSAAALMADLAADASMSVERAKEIAAKVPVAKPDADGYREMLRAFSPHVGHATADETARDARIAELRATAKTVRRVH